MPLSGSSAETMVLSLQQLQELATNVGSATSGEEARSFLEPLLVLLGDRAELTASFRAGHSGYDYAGVLAIVEQLTRRNSNCWAEIVIEKLQGVALSIFQATGSAEAVEDEDSVDCCWALAALAVLLPLMAETLPRDHNGVCIIPHQHAMERQEADADTLYLAGSGRPFFRTNKVCDNCQTRIVHRYFYHCSENCDIDFCEVCYHKLKDILNAFFENKGDSEEGRAWTCRQLDWVIDITDRVSAHILHLNAEAKLKLAQELAFSWPTDQFARLVRAVVDVVNAKVVHVQDVKDVSSDERFWCTVGFLQFLYACNTLPCSERRITDEDAPAIASRGPRIDYEAFVMEGINKCEPISEWQRWREHPSAQVPDVLRADCFQLSEDFCSFLTHNNLVPVSFRRVCLLCDVWEQIQLQKGKVVPLHVEVRREPKEMLEDILTAFAGLSDDELRRPLRVTFQNEDGTGPGVTKEFFQVALRSFLSGHPEDKSENCLFEYDEVQRTYWFNPQCFDAESFRACGILMGQAILNNVLVPNIFPRVMYERLLQELQSPYAKPISLECMAQVSVETARSLQRVVDYKGDDIEELFGDLGWERTGRIEESSALNQKNKHRFIQAYIDWYICDRATAQFKPLSEGFRSILGRSMLLRSMVDAVQLEKIVCGGATPVDMDAIKRGAMYEGWTPEEENEYLPLFWEVAMELTDSERIQLVVFVTASDRVPIRGWQDLALNVQKNGVGDDRLPTAYTCFCQLLLPKYSSKQKLRQSLLCAIANSEGFGLR